MAIEKVTLSPAIEQSADKPASQVSGAAPLKDGSSFENYLKAQIDRQSAVRFSAHAQRRLEARNIDFGDENVVRLEQAVDQAAQKGARESLILMDDLALVVSVKNRVVITAIDAHNRKENVFTNIDSVVLT